MIVYFVFVCFSIQQYASYSSFSSSALQAVIAFFFFFSSGAITNPSLHLTSIEKAQLGQILLAIREAFWCLQYLSHSDAYVATANSYFVCTHINSYHSFKGG